MTTLDKLFAELATMDPDELRRLRQIYVLSVDLFQARADVLKQLSAQIDLLLMPTNEPEDDAGGTEI